MTLSVVKDDVCAVVKHMCINEVACSPIGVRVSHGRHKVMVFGGL